MTRRSAHTHRDGEGRAFAVLAFALLLGCGDETKAPHARILPAEGGSSGASGAPVQQAGRGGSASGQGGAGRGGTGGSGSTGGDGTSGSGNSVGSGSTGGSNGGTSGAGGAAGSGSTGGSDAIGGTAGNASAGSSGSGNDAGKPGYRLTFEDDFTSGDVPDPEVYFYFYTWGDEANAAEDPAFLQGDTVTTGRGGYVADAQTVSNGTLRIAATAATARYGGLDFPYRTGVVRVREPQLYGLFEIRAKMPPGVGLWPAFWLMPEEYDDSALWEIDVLEAPSTAATAIHMNVHWGSGFDTPNHLQNRSTFAGNFVDGFHVFTLSWEPDAIIWYVDGVERKRHTSENGGIPSVPMQVICNLAVGGTWPGPPDTSTPFPAVFEVDYIRAYQKQ